MFLPTPEELKKRRTNLNLTQNELARLAGVSQPLIARIESGDVDPRLSTLTKIFDAFVVMEKQRIKACDIMHTPVIQTHPESSVEEAVDIMEKEGFSQVPVIENGVPVGSISSDMVVHSMTERDTEKLSNMKVKEIMGSSFPSVSQDTIVSTISHLLEQSPAVMVVEQGKVVGVVTQHDVMKLVHKKIEKP
jgi:predicted transcriptional regulator